MKTLIELYDERPLENVLASEMFRPECTVFLCPAEVAQNRAVQEKLDDFFQRRGLSVKTVFLESSQYNTAKILRQLQRIQAEYPDCVLDITGGTDAALYAAGLFGAQEGAFPVFTYSRKRNCFFDIHNAGFAEELPCDIQYSVEDFFLMAGGAMRPGRVNNRTLSNYLPGFEPFFNVFLRFRRDWNDLIVWMQRASQVPRDVPITLGVNAAYTQKGERSNRIPANEDALRALQDIGYIHDLQIEPGQSVRFTFSDIQIRSWLRDQGSVLELYVYKACCDSGLFNDVCSSAVVDWEGGQTRDDVTNEIDVMATSGLTPVFISCKTCEIKTEALNELAILQERFGSGIARSAIVTTEHVVNATRRRARELGIAVIDLDDLKNGALGAGIQSLMS